MDYKLSDHLGEGRGVGGIRLGDGVMVVSHLGDDSNKNRFNLDSISQNYAKNKKVLYCNGQCHCCADTSECYDLLQL